MPLPPETTLQCARIDAPRTGSWIACFRATYRARRWAVSSSCDATGTQGGAVARELVKKGHRVRALTRNVVSPAAQALAALGVELSQGDLEDRVSIDRALTGMQAMFSVATPYERGPEAETRQSILAADAAADAGAYLVYSSVANADRKSGAPHFDSKFAVEQHIRRRGIEATILAPVYFMENAFFGLAQLRQGVYGSPLLPTRPLMQVAVSDIAGAAVAALENRDRHAAKRYDLAGDELSGEEVAAVLSKVTGRQLSYFQVPKEMIRGAMGGDAVKMYDWFEATGYSADRAALQRDFPEVPWLSFEAWTRAQDWKKLLAG
jgi:uncharacterized protein YbjT (DUF2867 family)